MTERRVNRTEVWVSANTSGTVKCDLLAIIADWRLFRRQVWQRNQDLVSSDKLLTIMERMYDRCAARFAAQEPAPGDDGGAEGGR